MYISQSVSVEVCKPGCKNIFFIEGHQSKLIILEHAIQGGDYNTQLEKGRKRYLEKMEVLHKILLDEGLPEMGWNWQKPEVVAEVNVKNIFSTITFYLLNLLFYDFCL